MAPSWCHFSWNFWFETFILLSINFHFSKLTQQPNKGLRLDYFVCDPALFDESSPVLVRDSYMDHEQLGSDHCPVILELEIKGGFTS